MEDIHFMVGLSCPKLHVLLYKTVFLRLFLRTSSDASWEVDTRTMKVNNTRQSLSVSWGAYPHLQIYKLITSKDRASGISEGRRDVIEHYSLSESGQTILVHGNAKLYLCGDINVPVSLEEDLASPWRTLYHCWTALWQWKEPKQPYTSADSPTHRGNITLLPTQNDSSANTFNLRTTVYIYIVVLWMIPQIHLMKVFNDITVFPPSYSAWRDQTTAPGEGEQVG